MRLVIIVLLALLAWPTSATQKTHPATIAYVIDAGTYALDVDINGQTQRVKLVLNGLELPKLYGPICERRAALVAKSFVKTILWPKERVVVSNVHVEKSRLTGDITFDGRDLAQTLIRFKQARPADNKGSWCS